MADLPEGRICHATAHRLRMKVPERRHDAEFFRAVEGKLSRWQSVDRVEVNPLTASILVHFTSPAALFADNMQRNDLFRVSYPDLSESDGKPWLAETQSALRKADERVRDWFGPRADLRFVIIAALVASAAHQAWRGNITAPATTLLWYALRLTGFVESAEAAEREMGAA